jgi:hypothetical protein
MTEEETKRAAATAALKTHIRVCMCEVCQADRERRRIEQEERVAASLEVMRKSKEGRT